jgi:hypothetical protein
MFRSQDLARLPAAVFFAFFCALGLKADTLSNTVCVIERSAAEGQTYDLSFPVASVDVAGVRSAVSSSSSSGDLLHLWQGTHFASYVYSESVSDWLIPESTVPMPAARMPFERGQGWLVTRRASGETVVRAVGDAPMEDAVTVSVPAGSRALLGSPYPEPLSLSGLAAAGAAAGDRVRFWLPDSGGWVLFERTAADWEGPSASSTPVAVAGGCVLYYNASSSPRLLTFHRTYEGATRP